MRRTAEGRESEGRAVMVRIPVVSDRTRKRADFSLVLITRKVEESVNEAEQMTTARAVGAVSDRRVDWKATRSGKRGIGDQLSDSSVFL